MGSILRNNRRMLWEILNRIIGRKNRIIGTGLVECTAYAQENKRKYLSPMGSGCVHSKGCFKLAMETLNDPIANGMVRYGA